MMQDSTYERPPHKPPGLRNFPDGQLISYSPRRRKRLCSLRLLACLLYCANPTLCYSQPILSASRHSFIQSITRSRSDHTLFRLCHPMPCHPSLARYKVPRRKRKNIKRRKFEMKRVDRELSIIPRSTKEKSFEQIRQAAVATAAEIMVHALPAKADAQVAALRTVAREAAIAAVPDATLHVVLPATALQEVHAGRRWRE